MEHYLITNKKDYDCLCRKLPNATWSSGTYLSRGWNIISPVIPGVMFGLYKDDRFVFDSKIDKYPNAKKPTIKITYLCAE